MDCEPTPKRHRTKRDEEADLLGWATPVHAKASNKEHFIKALEASNLSGELKTVLILI